MLTRSLVGLFVLVLAVHARSASFGDDLFSGFETGWKQAWMERAMARKSNSFRVEGDRERNEAVLRVDSRDSASALWRTVDFAMSDDARLSWKWKVSMSLDHIEDERRKKSDDYAARVAVMFDGKPFDRSTPFLMYVWAGNESVGNVYPSPYTDNAATIVLRSGDMESGEWLMESRDVGADFERYFGRAAERVTGVALMVDTDNTDSETTAWFDELVIDSRDSGDTEDTGDTGDTGATRSH